jgi:LysR family transcriptional regulator for metE and metH
MEIRHLKLVQTVADAGTLTAAAEKLHLSQSALSHQLRDLETELGITVFYRSARRMTLTQAGKRLLEAACRVLCEIEKAETEIRRINTGEGGRLRLVTACYTCYHWLPGILKKFRSIYPGVEIAINVAATADPYAHLLSGDLDLGIVNRRVPEPALEYQTLFEDEEVVLIGNNHPWRKRKFVLPKDLANQHLVVFDSHLKESNLFKKVLTPAGITPKQIVKLPMTEAILEMVKSGLGITVMVKWAAVPQIRSSQIIALPLTEKGVKRIWYSAVVKDRYRPDYVQGFIDQIRENAGQFLRSGRSPRPAQSRK